MNDIKFKAYLKLTNETVDVQKIDIENKQISFYKNNDDGYLYVCDFKNIEFIFDQQDIRQQLAEKGREMNPLIADYEKRISQEQELMSNMEQQLDEKDKEIGTLKQELEEINAGYDFTYEQSSGAIKELKQNQTQLAIQELEKVKILIQNAINFEKPNFVGVYDAINKQIKELKGEKDVKD